MTDHKQHFDDSLVNLVSKLGTERDKASSSHYEMDRISDVELNNAYRTSWLARSIIDKRANDATRKWREWNGDDKQIEIIEAYENKLGLRRAVNKALKMKGLLGGSAIYIHTGDNTAKPLAPESVGRGGIKFVTVLSKNDLIVGPLEKNPLDERYGKPVSYKVKTETGEGRDVHWSRLVIFDGVDSMIETQWGDSELQACMGAIKQFDGTCANAESLVYEAKIDVFGIDGLSDLAGTPEGREKIATRYGVIATMKGINQSIVMDKEHETYDQKTVNFSGLTDIMREFQQNAAGAAGYPKAVLFGTSAGGLGSNGELELSNYYDSISEVQENEITPALAILDECLIRSALGSRPEELFYDWRSLWQVSAKDKADIGKTIADTVKTLSDTMLFNEDALRDAAATAFDESGSMQGIGSLAPEETDEAAAIGPAVEESE